MKGRRRKTEAERKVVVEEKAGAERKTVKKERYVGSVKQ